VDFAFLAPQSFEALPGQGVRADVDGIDVFLGRPNSLEKQGIAISSEIAEKAASLESSGCSVIMMAMNGRTEGLFVFEDELRPESKPVVGD